MCGSTTFDTKPLPFLSGFSPHNELLTPPPHPPTHPSYPADASYEVLSSGRSTPRSVETFTEDGNDRLRLKFTQKAVELVVSQAEGPSWSNQFKCSFRHEDERERLIDRDRQRGKERQ